jgi:transposase InsO family protein
MKVAKASSTWRSIGPPRSCSLAYTKLAAAAFLRVLIKTVPHKIHTILTDDGVQFVQYDQGSA